MLKRFWRYFLALFSNDLNEVEDPEVLLSQAQREMTEMHARNRERAVQAITQKNNLQQMVDDTQKRVDVLQAKIERAREQGDEVLAEQLIREKAGYEETLTLTRRNLTQAIETVDAVKAAIRREEEAIRTKTAETLALKAQWKNRQIEEDLWRRQVQDLLGPPRPPSGPNPAVPLAVAALILSLLAVLLSVWLYAVR